MPSESSRFPWLKRYWPTMIMVSFIALPAYDIYDRHHIDDSKWSDVDKMETVPSRVFRNETVVLDGKFFAQPTFDRVTFVYNGTAGFAMDNAHFIPVPPGQLAWVTESRNPAVTTTIKFETLLFTLSGCSGNFEDRGNQKFESTTPQ